MRWILGIDTSGRWCGVALLDGERVAGEERVEAAKANRALLPAIDRLCRGAGIGPRQLDGIAVALGPGSFTGLRIGLAAAKGLALALDRPVAGAGSLDAMVLAAAGGGIPGGHAATAPAADPRPEDTAGAGPFLPGGDLGNGARTPWLVARRARRGEVYAAVYSLDHPAPAGEEPPGRQDVTGVDPAGRAPATGGHGVGPGPGVNGTVPAAGGDGASPAEPVAGAGAAGGPPAPADPEGHPGAGSWSLPLPPGLRRLWGPDALAPADLLDRLPSVSPLPWPRWVWVADADAGLGEELAARGVAAGEGPRCLPDPGPCAAAVALLAVPRLAAGGDDPAGLVPLYLPAVPGYRPYPG